MWSLSANFTIIILESTLKLVRIFLKFALFWEALSLKFILLILVTPSTIVAQSGLISLAISSLEKSNLASSIVSCNNAAQIVSTS